MRSSKIVSYVNNADETHVQFRTGSDPCDLCLVNFGHHCTQPGRTYGPLTRDFTLIHFVVAGSGFVVANNVRYTIKENQVFLLRPNEIYYYESDSETPWEYYYIGFRGNQVPELLSDAGFGKDTVGRTYNKLSMVVPLLKTLCATVDDPHQPWFQLGCLYQILHYLICHTTTEDSDISADSKPHSGYVDYVKTATGIIHHGYSDNISVEALAERLNISRGYLNHIFRKRFDMSVCEYIKDYRLKKACDLLKMTNKPIKDIAAEVGYNDPLYFSRIFKKNRGITPNMYREQQQ